MHRNCAWISLNISKYLFAYLKKNTLELTSGSIKTLLIACLHVCIMIASLDYLVIVSQCKLDSLDSLDSLDLDL